MRKAHRLIVLLIGSVLPGLVLARTFGPPYWYDYDFSLPHGAAEFPTIGAAEAGQDAYLATNYPKCRHTRSYDVPGWMRSTGIVELVYFTNFDEESWICAEPFYGPPGLPYETGIIHATEYPDSYGDLAKNLGAAGTCDGGEGSEGSRASEHNAPNSCPAAKGAPMVGDLINLGSGNKYLQDDDYDAIDWLRFRRFYNSQRAVASTAMGAQWRHSFDRSLEAVGSQITVFRPDGTQETFEKVAGGWAAGAGIADVLTERKDAQGAVAGYTLYVAAHRHMETYDAKGRLYTVTDQAGVGITLIYDEVIPAAGGRPVTLLSQVTDPSGRRLSFRYSLDGTHLTGVVLPGGGALHYEHDAAGNLTSVTYPDGKVHQYAYAEAALGGDSYRYPHALTAVVDEAGERYETIRYAGDRAVATSFAGGAGTVVTNDYRGVVFPLGAIARISTVPENGLSRVGGVSNPCGPSCGQPWQWRHYDTNGNPQDAIDFNGHVTATTYDDNNLLTRQVEAKGEDTERTTDITWDAALRLQLQRTLRDAKGVLQSQTLWVHNAQGKTVARCDADPAIPGAVTYACSDQGDVPAGVRRWRYTYCTALSDRCPLVGLMLTAQGPRIDATGITRFSYYPTTDESGCGTVGGICHRAGDLFQVTDALGHVTTAVTYDKDGRLLRQRDANGVITDRTYSARGWLLSHTIRAHADGAPSTRDSVTTLTYTPYGALATRTDPDGITIRYSYDAAHRLTEIGDAQGNRIRYTLDAAGNKTREETFDTSGALRRSLTRSYNTLGQLTGIQDGLGRTVFDASVTGYGKSSYDVQGHLILSADGQGVRRTRGYDALGRPISTIDNDHGTDAATRDTESLFVYGAHDELQGVSDPDGLDTTYDYDGLGNAIALHSPDTGDSTSAYDAAGNRVQATDTQGQTTRYTYDALNRLIATRYSDAMEDVSYHYDEANAVTQCTASYPIGRLTRIVEHALTTTYCYDARGNVTRMRKTQGGRTETLTYTYTLADRVRTETRPSGAVVAYAYNKVGQVRDMTVTPMGGVPRSVASEIRYLPFGPVQSYVLGNGQTLSRSYDANYRVSDISSPALSLHLVRDVMGNITTVTEGGTDTAGYRYDPLYRLTSVDDATGKAIEAYTYNRTGDRLSKQGPGLLTGTYTYAPGTHHLIGVGTTTREVDARGDTTASLPASGTYSFEYNARHRLVRVTKDGIVVGAYTLNALGQRVQKVADGVTTRFTYDVASQLLAEAAGNTTRDYLWLGGVPVGVLNQEPSGATLTYVHADALGTSRAVTDDTGALLWRWPYATNPFGEAAPASAAEFVLNLRFPGQYFDAESGLNYNVNRDYESAKGGYLQPDPMGLAAGPSLYAYVGEDPLNYMDPAGLDAVLMVNTATVPISGRYAGHAAVAIGNNDTGWTFYQEGGFAPDGTTQLTTAATFASLQDMEWALTEYTGRFGNPLTYREAYDRQEGLHTLPGQDILMRTYADEHLHDTYSGASNNCGDFVVKVLRSGGLSPSSNPIFPTIPRMMSISPTDDPRRFNPLAY